MFTLFIFITLISHIPTFGSYCQYAARNLFNIYYVNELHLCMTLFLVHNNVNYIPVNSLSRSYGSSTFSLNGAMGSRYWIHVINNYISQQLLHISLVLSPNLC